MKLRGSSVAVKKLNRNRVFRYMNGTEKTSIPDIANALEMSVPTALQMVNELKDAGLAEEVGEFQSTGGRKAKAIATVKSVCYAIGIDITRNHLGIVLTDLSQKVLHHERVRKAFRNEEQYFIEVAEMIDGFVKEKRIQEEKIMGIGFAVPAIVDSSRRHISFSHALDIRDVSLEQHLAHIPYPSAVLNDAKAAAMTECIKDPSSRNMVYLSLSNTVGGAIAMKRDAWEQGGAGTDLFMGDNWRSGEFGHTVIHPDGRQCHCGKRGCLDAYCSAQVLSRCAKGSLALFLEKMEQGDQECQEIWETYLEDLAIAVDNLRMSFDCDVILGGYVGSFMSPHIRRIRKKAAAKNIFGNTGDYVKACSYLVEASALGAAMYQIEKYVSTI